MMTAPCSLNVEPYLCEWHGDLETGIEIWIQTSEDQENPKWMRLGNILEKIWFEDKYNGLDATEDRYHIDHVATDLYRFRYLFEK